jgi:hypothetical protein
MGVHSNSKSSSFQLKAVDDLVIETLFKKQEYNPDIWTSSRRARRDHVHAFFLYPAMMVPDVQKELVDVIVSSQSNVKRLFDPYVGAGTSLVAGMLNGLSCYGQDINPMAILLSKVRTGGLQVASFVRRVERGVAPI